MGYIKDQRQLFKNLERLFGDRAVKYKELNRRREINRNKHHRLRKLSGFSVRMCKNLSENLCVTSSTDLIR